MNASRRDSTSATTACGSCNKSSTFKFQPQGSSAVFDVEIPRGIILAFCEVGVGEKADVVESLGACWKRLNEEWRAAKLKPVVIGVRATAEFNPPVPEPGPDFISEMLRQEQCSNDPKVKEEVLQLVRFCQYRQLNAPWIMPLMSRAALQAIRDNDHEFFKRLGRQLEKTAITFTPPKEGTPLEKLLLEHWITQDEAGPQFCCFTDQALADFLHLVAPSANPTFDSVRKTRQRLQLRQTHKKLVKVSRCVGRKVVLA